MTKPTSTPLPSRRMLLVLLATVAVCYVHGMYTDYIFDDSMLILENDAIRTIEGLPGLLGLGDKGGVPQHRAVRNLSYALDHLVWGTNLRGYHITNITIHLFNAMLVLGIAWHLFADKRWALLSALLWGVHPVHTESVTYLSGRRDVLAGLFYLWVFYLYLTWRIGIGGRLRLAGAMLAYVAGCFAKEHVVTIPGAIVLYEVVRALAGRPDGEGIVRYLARAALAQFRRAPLFYAAIAVYPLVFTPYVLRFHPHNIAKMYVMPALPTDLLSIAKYGAHYLGLMVFPRNLAMDYYPTSLAPSTGLGEPATLGALALLAALALVTLYAIRKGSVAGFGAGWFVITFLPMSNLFIRSNEPVAEHYLYLPAVGFAIAVVSGLVSLSARWPLCRPVLFVLALAAVVALGVRTDLRNREWEEPDRVFKASLEVFPKSQRLWNNLACFYLGRKRFEEALPAIERAIELAPREAISHYNHAYALRKMGRFAQAKKAYETAMLVPDYLEPRVGLAFLLIQMKDFAGAVKMYDRILKMPYNESQRWYYLHWRGVAYRDLGDFAKARADLTEALLQGRRHPETLWHMALLFKKEARAGAGARTPALFAQAEKLLVEARAAAPESALLAYELGDLYQTMGSNAKALAQYEAMAQANDEFAAESALAAARVLVAMGDRARARTAYERAKSLQFADAELERALASPAPGAAAGGPDAPAAAGGTEGVPGAPSAAPPALRAGPGASPSSP